MRHAHAPTVCQGNSELAGDRWLNRRPWLLELSIKAELYEHDMSGSMVHRTCSSIAHC